MMPVVLVISVAMAALAAAVEAALSADQLVLGAVGVTATAASALRLRRKPMTDQPVGWLLVAAMAAMTATALLDPPHSLVTMLAGLVLGAGLVGRLTIRTGVLVGSRVQVVDAALIATGLVATALPALGASPEPAVLVRVLASSALVGLLATVVLDRSANRPSLTLLTLAGAAMTARPLLAGLPGGIVAAGAVEAAGFVLAAAIAHQPHGAADLTTPVDVVPGQQGRRSILVLVGAEVVLLVSVAIADAPPWLRDVWPGLARAVDGRLLASLVIGVALMVRFRHLLAVVDAATDKVEAEAARDPLTGLANRHAVIERLVELLASGRHVLVVAGDVDGFRYLSATLGHVLCDRLLADLSAVIREHAPTGSVVGRLGADQFLVLVPDHDPDDRRTAEAVARRLIDAAAHPVLTDAAPRVTVSLSVGSVTAAPGSDADVALRQALSAVRQAKSLGRGQHADHSPEMDRDVELNAALVSDLRTAHLDGQLHLAVQPIVDLDTGAVVSAEALLRWTHPVHGPIPPDRFIPLAESSGMIGTIGRWVLEQAAALAVRVQVAAHYPDLAINVNVSPLQLRRGEFVQEVREVLATTGLRPELLHLEITEGVYLDDTGGVDATLGALAATGVRIGLDDFGTGYSSIGYLHRLPLSFLKLDAAISSRIVLGDPLGRSLARFVAALPYPVIAEGIEDDEDCASLRQHGCSLGQGYGLGRPVGEAALIDVIGRTIGGDHGLVKLPGSTRKAAPAVMPSGTLPVGVVTPADVLVGAIDADVGGRSVPAVMVGGETLCRDVSAWFVHHPDLHVVVVTGADGKPCALARADFDARMAGRLGFGRTLFWNKPVIELGLRPATVLPAGTTLLEAVEVALDRRLEERYDDLVVTAADQPMRTVSVAEMLAAASQSLARLALRDPLTELANRWAFMASLRTTARAAEPYALLFIDLDGFKDVNDTHGHSAGDAVLMVTASRLRDCTGDLDVDIARLAGDEFAVLLRDPADLRTARTLGDALVDALAHPVSIGDDDVTIGASIGVMQGAPGLDPVKVLQGADRAMYRAKRAGRGRVVVEDVGALS